MIKDFMEILAVICGTAILLLVVCSIKIAIEDWKDNHIKLCPKCGFKPNKWIYKYCPCPVCQD